MLFSLRDFVLFCTPYHLYHNSSLLLVNKKTVSHHCTLQLQVFLFIVSNLLGETTSVCGCCYDGELGAV